MVDDCYDDFDNDDVDDVDGGAGDDDNVWLCE